MKYLDELIEFTIGKNVTRINNKTDFLYSQEDFNKDLQNVEGECLSRSCVINLIQTKAAPLSKDIKKKCLTSNFLLCSFDIDILDPWYFCYQFNEGKHFKHQISRYHQGSTVSVKKLSISSIRELQIKLPSIEKQRAIGNMYRQSILQYELMCKQANNMKQLVLSVITKMEEE